MVAFGMPAPPTLLSCLQIIVIVFFFRSDIQFIVIVIQRWIPAGKLLNALLYLFYVNNSFV
jgi:hypothetical protein